MTEPSPPSLEQLSPPVGGLERLLAKRHRHEQRVRGGELALATSIMVVLAMQLFPTRTPVDLGAVRERLLFEPSPSFAIAGAPATITQQGTRPGVRVYLIATQPRPGKEPGKD